MAAGLHEPTHPAALQDQVSIREHLDLWNYSWILGRGMVLQELPDVDQREPQSV